MNEELKKQLDKLKEDKKCKLEKIKLEQQIRELKNEDKIWYRLLSLIRGWF